MINSTNYSHTKYVIYRLYEFIKLNERLFILFKKILFKIVDHSDKFPFLYILNFIPLSNLINISIGYNEPEVTNLLTNLNMALPFIDIGACIGKYSKIMLNRCPKVISIEPDPFNMFLLKKNIGSRVNIEYLQVAIGKDDRIVKFYRYKSIGLSSVKQIKSKIIDSFDVRVVSLKKIINEDIGLIKVDVEGAEMDVLEGAEEVMSHIKSWLIEAHPPSDVERHDKLERRLTNFGYKTIWIDNSHIYAHRTQSI